jgi:hypothetical protein
MKSIYDIEKQVNELLKRTEVKDFRLKIFYGNPLSQETLFVNIFGEGYIFGYHERGQIETIIRTDDVEELKYHIIKQIILEEASEFEFKNRIKYQDSRRLRFRRGLELMGKINYIFYNKLLEDINLILKQSPYDDSSNIVFDCLDEYKKILQDILSEIMFKLINRKLSEQIRGILKNVGIGPSQVHNQYDGYDRFFKEMTLQIDQIMDSLGKVESKKIKSLTSQLREVIDIAKKHINA